MDALPACPDLALSPQPLDLDRAPPGGLLDRLLRDPRGLSADIASDRDTAALLRGLLQVTAVGAALYGGAVGLTGGPLQALAGAVKLPLIVLGGAAVSLPILHMSCALAGVRLRFRQLSALVLQALATGSVTMAGLAPVIAVWWLTQTAAHSDPWFTYRRVVLAAVAVAAVGGLVGAARLLRALPLRALAPWTLCLGLSTLQLAWLLRPLVGMPDRDAVLLRALESDALRELLTALGAVLS